MLTKIKFPGKDTRLVRKGRSIYKVTVQTEGSYTEFDQKNLGCSEGTIQKEIENAIHVAILMSKDGKFTNFKSDHFIFLPEQVDWKASTYLQFSQHKQVLSAHPFIIILRVRAIPNPPSGAELSTSQERSKVKEKNPAKDTSSVEFTVPPPPQRWLKRNRESPSERLLDKPEIRSFLEKEALSMVKRSKGVPPSKDSTPINLQDIKESFRQSLYHLTKSKGDITKPKQDVKEKEEEELPVDVPPKKKQCLEKDSLFRRPLRRSPRLALIHKEGMPSTEPSAGTTMTVPPSPVIQQARVVPHKAIQRPDRHVIEQNLLEEQMRLQRLATPVPLISGRPGLRSASAQESSRIQRRSPRKRRLGDTTEKAQNKGGIVSFLMTPFKRFLR